MGLFSKNTNNLMGCTLGYKKAIESPRPLRYNGILPGVRDEVSPVRDRGALRAVRRRGEEERAALQELRRERFRGQGTLRRAPQES